MAFFKFFFQVLPDWQAYPPPAAAPGGLRRLLLGPGQQGLPCRSKEGELAFSRKQTLRK